MNKISGILFDLLCNTQLAKGFNNRDTYLAKEDVQPVVSDFLWDFILRAMPLEGLLQE